MNRSVKVVLILLVLVVFGGVVYLLSSWRPSDHIDGTYGRQRGIVGAKSVNGTAVLAELFRQRDIRVSTWKRLSPRLRRADVVVWIPNDFSPPTDEHCRWFEEWIELDSERPKTLIYVGRDFDARVAYWNQMVSQAPADQVSEVLRRRARAMSDQDAERLGLPAETSGPWFTVHRSLLPRKVDRFEGPWSTEFNTADADVRLASRFRFGGDSNDSDLRVETLLAVPAAGEDPAEPLVTRLKYAPLIGDDSQILVVTNGSFLLNLPLVNHEHRKLAAKLIDQCGQPEDVVFLESESGGPPIIAKEPELKPPGAMQMMSVWPLSAIITHVIAVGILLCFALYPIFGHPRSLVAAPRSDFSKHIDSLGKLLAKTEDIGFANTKIQYYQHRVRRESGASHMPLTRHESAAEPLVLEASTQDATPSEQTQTDNVDPP